MLYIAQVTWCCRGRAPRGCGPREGRGGGARSARRFLPGRGPRWRVSVPGRRCGPFPPPAGEAGPGGAGEAARGPGGAEGRGRGRGAERGRAGAGGGWPRPPRAPPVRGRVAAVTGETELRAPLEHGPGAMGPRDTGLCQPGPAGGVGTGEQPPPLVSVQSCVWFYSCWSPVGMCK